MAPRRRRRRSPRSTCRLEAVWRSERLSGTSTAPSRELTSVEPRFTFYCLFFMKKLASGSLRRAGDRNQAPAGNGEPLEPCRDLGADGRCVAAQRLGAARRFLLGGLGSRDIELSSSVRSLGRPVISHTSCFFVHNRLELSECEAGRPSRSQTGVFTGEGVCTCGRVKQEGGAALQHTWRFDICKNISPYIFMSFCFTDTIERVKYIRGLKTDTLLRSR